MGVQGIIIVRKILCSVVKNSRCIVGSRKFLSLCGLGLLPCSLARSLQARLHGSNNCIGYYQLSNFRAFWLTIFTTFNLLSLLRVPLEISSYASVISLSFIILIIILVSKCFYKSKPKEYSRASTNGHLFTKATFCGGQSIHWLLFKLL